MNDRLNELCRDIGKNKFPRLIENFNYEKKSFEIDSHSKKKDERLYIIFTRLEEKKDSVGVVKIMIWPMKASLYNPTGSLCIQFDNETKEKDTFCEPDEDVWKILRNLEKNL